MVQELLSNGAGVRGAPLLLSSLQGYLEIQKHFTETGGNHCFEDTDPVRAAALNGHWAVHRTLLAVEALPYYNRQALPYGCVFDSIPDEGPTAAPPARAPSPPRPNRPSVHHADERGDTALHLACQAGYTDAVRAMVSGALVDTRNHQGGTALMAASSGGHVECVRALLASNASASLVDGEGHTALWLAYGWWRVVRELVGAPGVDAAIKGAALAHALHQQFDEVAQVLRGEEVVSSNYSCWR